MLYLGWELRNVKGGFTMKCYFYFTIFIFFCFLLFGSASTLDCAFPQSLQTAGEDLSHLQPTLEWLKKIHPTYETFTLERVRDMKTLSLQLYSQATAQLITDANMVHVGRLKKLEQLRVHRMTGDAGFAHFAGLTNMKILNMPNCRITNAGMAHLKGMTKLENVILSATNVSDAGVLYLKDKPELKLINLTRTKITDAGMEHLKDLTALQKLFISYTNITDASIPIIKGFTNLNTLYMQGAHISNEGVQEITGTLPNCRIVR
jgi:Leucine-rich repeat (LRR) protein